jgi:hypothetical protein
VAQDGHASDRYGHLFPSRDDGAELAAAEQALPPVLALLMLGAAGAGKGATMNDPDRERRHLVQADERIEECKHQIARLEKLIQRQAERGDRTHAEKLNDETARQTMLRIADDYERLARHAERRAMHRSQS